MQVQVLAPLKSPSHRHRLMLKPIHTKTHNFSLSQARSIVQDCFRPSPVIYWTDFLVSIGLGHVCYGLVRRAPHLPLEPVWLRYVFQVVIFVVGCLLYYRSAMFIHELVHLRSGTFRGFRFVWNLLCGIPFLTPSFVYYTHIDHHRRKHFGTAKDGEYLPLGHQQPRQILFYLTQSFVLPPLAVVRFLLLTPLTWISPRFRRWIYQHASSMVMDPTYIRPLPTKRTLRMIRLQETLCFLWCLGVAIVPPIFLDRWPIPFLIQGYCTGLFIVMLNALRTLGSHRWSNEGDEMTFVGQMLDSVNVDRHPWLSELWGPVGTRFHGLHHLFPSLPYHEMPRAHRKLMAELPPDSPYRLTVEPSLTGTIGDLWKRAEAATPKETSMITSS